MKAALLNPELFEGAGLADNFDGVIVDAYFCPWDYNGKVAHHSLAAAVTFRPDPDSGWPEFTQHYSAGSLKDFQPSTDGDNPVDLDSDDEEAMRGPYAVPVGTRTQLNNSSNLKDFLDKLIIAGFDPAEATPNLREMLTGIRGHFDRVAQVKRSGLINPGAEEGGRANTILVATEIYERVEVDEAPAPKAKGKAKAKGKTKAKPRGKSQETVDEAELAEELVELIVNAIAETDDGVLSKAKLPSLLMSTYKDRGRVKAAAVTMVNKSDFLSERDEWEFDGKTLSFG